MNEYETVKYIDGDFSLDVSISPKEDTVWLSKNDMAALFDRDRSVITRHIQNVFREGECSKESNVHFLHVPSSDKPVELYSLDIVVSVGYRIKSKRGVLFRRWATSVLKSFMLKGYVVAKKRTLVTDENYVSLINEVNSIGKRVNCLESKLAEEPKERIFFAGSFFDAYEFVSSIIKSAKMSLIMIDPYADETALKVLSQKRENVSLKVFLSSASRMKPEAVSAFNKEYGGLMAYRCDSFHDRFLIIDNAIGYHIGASLNALGKKAFEISKIEDYFIVESIIKEARKHE